MAAYSTVSALYAGYDGSLYQIKRASDGTTTNVGLLSTGGYGNATEQDVFCAHTNCVITELYNQSGRGNNARAVRGYLDGVTRQLVLSLHLSGDASHLINLSTHWLRGEPGLLAATGAC